MSALPKHEADSVVSELPSPKGPGARLKSAREAKSLNLEKVAAQLHLSNEMLMSLEADDYGNLPARVFVVGYLRNYARLVGLPAEAITQALDHFLPVEQEPVIDHSKAAAGSRSGSSRATLGYDSGNLFIDSKRRSFPFFKFLLILGAAIAVFWGWKQGYFSDVLNGSQSISQQFKPVSQLPLQNAADSERGSETGSSQQNESDSFNQIALPESSAEIVDTEVEATDEALAELAPAPVAPDQLAPVPVIQVPVIQDPVIQDPVNSDLDINELDSVEPVSPVVTASVAVNESVETMQAPAAQEASVASAVAAGQPEIVLSLTETCWIKVRDSAGDFRMNNNYEAGTVKTFTGTPPYNILIGNVGGATLTIDGEPFDLSGYTKKNVARLVLDPGNL